MASAFHDPLSPFSDPHRDAPWPATPHTAADLPPTLVRASSTQSQVAAIDRSISNGTNGGLGTGPWGKEPQIYGQPEPGLVSPQTTKPSNGQLLEKPEPYLRVRITALDRNRRDILVRFDAQTNLTNFTGTAYRNISRSYVEFQRFYEQIVYSNPQTIIPALPLPQTAAPTDEEDDRLVRVMLQRWCTRVCEDPILLNDEEVRSFIESDFGYQPMPRKPRRAGSGFSLLSRRPPDEDEELQRARFELTRLETQYLEVAKAIDKLARARKGMSIAHAEMGNKLVDFAATEVHPPLASATRKMGRAWHSYSDLDQAQAISDCVILGDTLGYQGMNARSAKETLLQRSAVIEEYQEAVKATISKRRNIERLKASSNIRPERVDDALEDLEEANKVENHLHQRVEGISQNLHRALHRHSRIAHEDIAAALIEHARTNILYERQLLRELESLLPDVRASANPAPLQPVGTSSIPPLVAALPPAFPGGIPPRSTMTTGTFLPRTPVASQTSVPPSPSPQQSPIPPFTVAPSPISPTIASSSAPPPQPNDLPSPIAPRSPVPTLVTSSLSTSSSPLPAFPKTNQFTPNVMSAGTGAITPGFPKTSQFASPSRPAPSASAFAAFPRTSQFVPNLPSHHISAPTSPAYANGTQPHIPVTPNPHSPLASPAPQFRTTLTQSMPAMPPPASPQTGLQQQQQQLPPQVGAVDPLGGASRVISSPRVRSAQSSPSPLSASTSFAHPAHLHTQSPQLAVDPLTGSYIGPLSHGYGQPSPTSLNGQYTTSTNPLGVGIGPVPQQRSALGPGITGSFRGATNPPLPTRSRLDAREAASKLANLL